MKTTIFFQSVYEKINEKDQKIFLDPINHDKLIQSFLSDPDVFNQCVDKFGQNIHKWSLGKVACLSIGIKPEVLRKDVSEKFYLKQSISLYENNLKGIVDLDFQKATYIALALYERKRKNQSWDGLLEEISSRQPRKKVLTNWRTSLAILFSFLDYEEDLLVSLINEYDPYLGISFVNHMLSVQFLSHKEKACKAVALAEKLTIDNKIAFVQSWVAQLPHLNDELRAAISESRILSAGLFVDDSQDLEEKNLFDSTYKNQILNAFVHQLDGSQLQTKTNLKFAREKIKNILRFIDMNLLDGGSSPTPNDFSIYQNEPYFEDLIFRNQNTASKPLGNETQFSKGIISILDFANETHKRGEVIKAREIATNQFRLWLDKITDSWPSPDTLSYLSRLNHKQIIDALNSVGLDGLSAEYITFLYSLPMSRTALKNEYISAMISVEKFDQAYQELKTSLIDNPHQPDVYKNIFKVLKSSSNWKALFLEWKDYSKQFKLSQDDWVQYANSALNAEEFDDTQVILKKMSDEGVDQLEIDILQGKLHYKRGEFEAARILLENTTRQVPSLADGWIVLSDVYLEMGMIEKSMETLRTAVIAIPDSDEINFKLSKLCLDQELIAESLPYIRKANALNPNQPIYTRYLIRTLQTLGRSDEADTILNQARMKWTKDQEIAYLDAIRQVEKQNRDLALAAFEIAINSNISTVPIERIWVYVQVLLGDQKDKFLPTDGKYNVINNLLISQKYIKHLLEEKHEESKYIQMLLCEVYYLTGEIEAANSLYGKIINIFKEDNDLSNLLWRAYAGFGLAKITLNELDSGIAALEEASQLNSQHLGIKQKCTEAYYSAKLNDKAESKAEEIYELGSTQVENLLWYSDFMRIMGKPEKEIKGLQQMLHFEPDNFQANIRLAEIFIANGKIEEAYELINNLNDSNDIGDKDILKAVIALLRMEKNQEALNWFIKLSTPKNEIDVKIRKFEKIYLLLVNAIWTKGLSEIQQVKSYGINNHVVSSLEGYTLFHLGDYAASVSAFENSLILPKENIEFSIKELATKSIIPEAWLLRITNELETYSYLTKAYNYLHDFDHSLEVINRMVRVNPDNLWNYIWGAENAVQLTDFDLASDYLLKLKNSAKEKDWQKTEEFAAALEYTCAYLSGRDYKLTIKEPKEASELWKMLSAHQLIDQGRFTDAQELFVEIKNSLQYSEKLPSNQYRTEYVDLKNSITQRLMILLTWRLYDFKSLENLLGYQDGKSPKFTTVEEAYLRLAVNFSYKKINELFNLFEISDHKSVIIENEVNDHSNFKMIIGKIEKFGQTKAIRILLSLANLIYQNETTTSNNLLQSPNLPDFVKYVLIDELMKESQIGIVEEYINNHHCKPVEFTFYLTNHRGQSAEVVNAIINSSTSDDPIWLTMCSHLFEQNAQLEEAIEFGEKAISVWPMENNWLVRLAKLNQKAGNLDKAEAYWIEIIHREQNPEEFIYQFADLLMENNKSQETLLLLDEFQQKISPSMKLHLLKANAFINEKSLDGLKDQIQKAKAFGQKSFDIDYIEAWAKYLDGKSEQALIKIQEILMMDPNNEKAHLLNAIILRETGRYQEAIKEINKSLQVCPNNKGLLIEKVNNLKNLKNHSEGLMIASELTQKYPGDTKTLNLLAELYTDLQDFHSAEKVARKSLKIDANQSSVHKLLGILAKEQGHLDQALDHFSKSVQIDNRDMEAWIEMGDIYFEQNEPEKALNAYKEACSRDDKNPMPYYKSGILLRDLKDYLGAEKMLRIASDLSPRDTSIRRQLAGVVALNLVHTA